MSNNNSFSGTDSFGSTTIPAAVTGVGRNERTLENKSASAISAGAGGGIDIASQYALRVALQTMKERCITLQQRLLIVEEENSLLRNQKIAAKQNNAQQKLAETTKDYLRKQIDDLAQQKSQLTEHIAMIAAENRQLWSRLSHLAKNDTKKDDQQQYYQQRKQRNSNGGSVSNSQNLIRSRTFTQNSPNPLLRKKHLAAVAAGGGITDDDKSLEDLSLEEISLKDVDCKYNDDEIEDDGNHVTMMIENSKLQQELIRSVTRRERNDSLGFGYLNDDSSDGDGIGGSNDLGIETKKCIDGIVDIKKEILKQQNELTILLSALKEKKELPPQECAECKYRSNNKPQMVDKIIETKDDLIDNINDQKISNNQNRTKTITDRTETLQINVGLGSTNNKIVNSGELENPRSSNHIDFLDEKQRADKVDKICPMCGRVFDSTVSFDSFQQHVEAHFIDDTDIDSATYERGFELISNAVSNF